MYKIIFPLDIKHRMTRIFTDVDGGIRIIRQMEGGRRPVGEGRGTDKFVGKVRRLKKMSSGRPRKNNKNSSRIFTDSEIRGTNRGTDKFGDSSFWVMWGKGKERTDTMTTGSRQVGTLGDRSPGFNLCDLEPACESKSPSHYRQAQL